MQLSIANQSFRVEEASLIAFVGLNRSDLLWRLEVNTEEGMSFWFEDCILPHLRRWVDLVGQSASWNTPLNPNTGEWDWGWYGAGLLAGNSEILESTLHFTEKSGCKFRIRWIGTASAKPLGCEPSPNEQLSFEIDCWCDFIGVGVLGGQDTPDSAKRELIEQFLNVEDFSEQFQETAKYVPGHLPMLRPPSC